MKKKFFLVFFTLCAVICLSLGLTACGKGDNVNNNYNESTVGGNNGDDNEFEDDGSTPTEGLIYFLNADKESYSLGGYESVGKHKNIVIANEIDGKPVTAIYHHIFYDHITEKGDEYIKTLTIPDNVKKIQCHAFEGLTSLEVVNIGSGLEEVEKSIFAVDENSPAGAFYGCENITQFNVSQDNAYFRSEGACLIKKASSDSKGGSQYDTLIYSGKGNIIPDSVGIIGKYCFMKRQQPLSSTIPSQIKKIEEFAFAYNTMVGTLNLNDGLVEVGDYAFEGVKGITGDLVIPNSVKIIGEVAFADFCDISSIKIGDGTETIGGGAFYADNITKTLEFIEVGKNVKRIGINAFSRRGSVPFAKEFRFLAQGNVVFESKIFYTYADRSLLNKFTLPATPSVLQAIKDEIIIVRSFEGLDLTITCGTIPSDFAEFAFGFFSTSAHIANLVIKKEVTKIEEGAFSEQRLNYAIFENFVMEYNPNRVIQGLISKAEIINLSVNANDIKYFSWITNLYVTGGQMSGNIFGDGSCLLMPRSFRFANTITNIDITKLSQNRRREKIFLDEGNTKYHCDEANTCLFDETNTLILGCSTTTIPAGVTKIGPQAFANTLTKLSVIPEGVTEIGANAFDGCSMVTISLPASLTKMDTSTAARFAFANCTSLQEINVNAANSIFSSQKGLLYNKDKTQLLYVPCAAYKIVIADTVSTLTTNAFKDLYTYRDGYKTSLTLGKGITKIEPNVFSQKAFSKIYLPIEFFNTTWKYGNSASERYEIKYTGVGEPTEDRKNSILEGAADFFLKNPTKTFERVQ